MRNETVIEILEAYNDAMAEKYNHILMNGNLPANLEMSRMDSLEKIVEHKMSDWMKEFKHKRLGGHSLYQFLEKEADLETSRAFLIKASYICDNGVPAVLFDLLTRWQHKLLPELVDYLLSLNWAGKADHDAAASELSTSVAALLDAMAIWLNSKQYDRLLQRYMAVSQPFEIISDGFKSLTKQLSLRPEVEIDQLMIKSIQNQLNSEKNLSVSGEHVLIALVSYQNGKGSGQGNGQVLACVKQCLHQASDKQLPIICLADLADPNGIPVLRDWLDSQTPASLDEKLVKEAVASLQRLGDDTKDLVAKYKLDVN